MTLYKELEVDKNKISCMDVNLSVINKFNFCQNKIKFDTLPKVLENLYDERLDGDGNQQDCIDLLGVYIAPIDNDKANVFLSKEKINDVANKYKIDFKTMYDFVKTHEYAHASMCPRLVGKDCIIDRDATYTLMEESLATAIALKNMKDTLEFEKLKQFVQKQPFVYRYGLKIFEECEQDLENIMVVWKLNKYNGEIDLKNYNHFKGFFFNELYKITNIMEFLPKSIRELFIF